MNALTFPRALLPAPNGDQPYCEACAVLADTKLGEAIEYLAQWTEAYFAAPARDPDQRAKVTAAMVSVAHARNLLEPLMVERGL